MQLLRGFVLLWLTALTAGAQFDFPGIKPFGPKRHTKARLVLSHEVAKPGDTVMAGVELTMDPGWHTYWQNPGSEFGFPTELYWNLPPDLIAGEIQWPLPEKYVDRTVGEAINLTGYSGSDGCPASSGSG